MRLTLKLFAPNTAREYSVRETAFVAGCGGDNARAWLHRSADLSADGVNFYGRTCTLALCKLTRTVCQTMRTHSLRRKWNSRAARNISPCRLPLILALRSARFNDSPARGQCLFAADIAQREDRSRKIRSLFRTFSPSPILSVTARDTKRPASSRCRVIQRSPARSRASRRMFESSACMHAERLRRLM